MKNLKIATCFLVVLFAACRDKSVTTNPSSGTITESVYAAGKVKAVNQYTVLATVNGILQNIKVNAGELVKKDQILFEMENKATALNSENARLAMELSQENSRKGSDKLQEMEANRNQAWDKYLLDSSLYLRQKKLWDAGVGTQLDFDQRRLTFSSSKDAYLAANNRFNQLKIALENELKRSKVSYNLTEKLQNDFSIKSELTGKLYDVLKEKGELVTPQTPLAIVGDADQFLMELEVDENDITKVHLGQAAIVTMDSYKGQAMEATITKIYPIMNERSRTFRIEATFNHPPKELYPNWSVEANIVIQTRNNVVTIPKEYLVEGHYVLVNKTEKKEVKTGLRDYKKVEITEGLTKEDKIYLPK